MTIGVLAEKGQNHREIAQTLGVTDGRMRYHRQEAQAVFPRSEVTVGRFPISELLNEAVDQVGRQEQKEHPELKGARYLWVQNSQDRRLQEAARLLELLPEDEGLRTPEAYRMKLTFQEFCRGPIGAVRSHLHRWCRTARQSGLESMIWVAKTLNLDQERLLNWFWSTISNGLVEQTSSLVRAAKAKPGDTGPYGT